MARVHRRESARRDLVSHFVYPAEEAGIETADRFLICADQTFADLARMPLTGPLVEVRRHELSGMRKWRVSGFENFLIFYIPGTGGVDIIRVIHGSQDWLKILNL